MVAKPCPQCSGAGRVGSNFVQCATCVGTGVAPYVPPPFAKYGTTRALCNKCGGSGKAGPFAQTCNVCRGTGRKLPVYETCPYCHGEGAVESRIGEMLECSSCSGDGALVHTA
jgi:DnaJ-class molecular chaperone